MLVVEMLMDIRTNPDNLFFGYQIISLSVSFSKF